ncbi:MAG: hypothetical protein ABIJ56_08580 [Pseudomonadota bacterium]
MKTAAAALFSLFAFAALAPACGNGYVINRTVSIGVFFRFVYTSDDIEVYEDDDNDPPGEDTEIFTLPKFLLTCGVSLLISF